MYMFDDVEFIKARPPYCVNPSGLLEVECPEGCPPLGELCITKWLKTTLDTEGKE